MKKIGMCCIVLFTINSALLAETLSTASILFKTGQSYEATLVTSKLKVEIGQKILDIPFCNILSLNTAGELSDYEKQCVDESLDTLLGKNRGADRHVGAFMQTDRRLCELATAQLVDIGLPVISPLFAALPEVDYREPKAAYRLYARIIPGGYADCEDRTLDLIRCKDGQALRGKILNKDLELRKSSSSKTEIIVFSSIRRLGIRQKRIDRVFDIHSYEHCTQVEFLDSGIILTSDSQLQQRAQGYIHLCYSPDLSCWSSGPDGLTEDAKTGHQPNNKIDGFAYGAILGRIGPDGPCWLGGSNVTKTGLGVGRLYFAINDSSHFQNNIGSYRVNLKVTNAYDIGEAK